MNPLMNDLQHKAQDLLDDLSSSARWLLKLSCDHAVSVRGIGSGKGMSTIARGLERKKLVTVDRRHWRDHCARATDLGRSVAALIPDTQMRNPY